MAELKKKEMSKIICKHLRKDSLVDGVSETYLIASVMDAVNEITLKMPTEAELRANVIDEFAEKFIYKAVCEGCSGCCTCYEEGRQAECEDWKCYMEIALQMKGEKE